MTITQVRSLIAYDLLDRRLNFKFGRVVQCRGRFVEQKDQGRIGQGARDGNALGFAARRDWPRYVRRNLSVQPGPAGPRWNFGRQHLTALGRSETEIVRHRPGKQDKAVASPCRVCGASRGVRCRDNRSPSTNTVPTVGSSSRLSSRSREVLPEPLGPTMARTSPLRNSKFASWTRIFPFTVRPRCSARKMTGLGGVLTYLSSKSLSP